MAARRPPRQYSDEDRKAALTLAAQIGWRAAGRELDISLTLLSRWRDKFPDHWKAVNTRTTEEVSQGFAARVDELGQAYAEVELEALDRAVKLIPRADGKELAAIGKMLSQGRTTAVSTSARLRGEPDQRNELNINFGQIEAAMDRLLGGPPSAPVLVENVAETDADDS